MPVCHTGPYRPSSSPGLGRRNNNNSNLLVENIPLTANLRRHRHTRKTLHLGLGLLRDTSRLRTYTETYSDVYDLNILWAHYYSYSKRIRITFIHTITQLLRSKQQKKPKQRGSFNKKVTKQCHFVICLNMKNVKYAFCKKFYFEHA